MVTALNYVPALSTIMEKQGVGGLATVLAGVVIGYSPGYAGISAFHASYYINEGLAEDAADAIIQFTPYMMQYVVPVFLILPILLIMMITALRSISPFIGGELQILGVTSLV